VFGFTLSQPAYVTYLIFTCVGLGMASPYILIGLFPKLVNKLPKPGMWMVTFKEFMGFLLLGTVVYLFTTINSDYFIPTLTLLVGLWFACWWIGRTASSTSERKKVIAWIGGAGVAGLVGAIGSRVDPHRFAGLDRAVLRSMQQARYRDGGRAVRELGVPQTPLVESIEKAYRWFVDHGYC